MSEISPSSTPSPEVKRQILPLPLQEQLLRCRLILKSPVSALTVWEQLLSAEDRAFLGGNMEDCYRSLGTVGMWMKLKGVSELRASVDLALELDHITSGTHKRLLREIGESETNHVRVLPVWNQDTGELRFGDQVVRRVRSRTRADNIVRILDAFQEDGWPDRIDDPLPGGTDSQRLREAVRTLNQDLEKIRFRADGTGTGIVWETAQTRATPAPGT